jgi:hypothetical protein
MDIVPVSKIKTPSYPKADQADAETLLSQYVPGRWSKAKGLAGAVAVAMAANFAGGCGSNAGGSSQPPHPSGLLNGPTPSFAEASDWVRSIYGKPQPQAVLMGDVVIPEPTVSEESLRSGGMGVIDTNASSGAAHQGTP